MPELELQQNLKQLYTAPYKAPILVEVPPMKYLMLDGQGNPNNSTEYEQALEALYGLAYTLKFGIKKSGGPEFKVSPLEGLWWCDNMAEFSMDNKADWKWTMMIAQPDFITPAQVEQATAELAKKKNPPALPKIRFESYAEGQCAQIMHLGPYSAEPPTIQKLHAFIKESGLDLRGKHHEIYLGDPRRTAPEKLKTIIRQPVSPK